MHPQITERRKITVDDLPVLKTLHRIALKSNQEMFGFEGIDISTDYCGYLIEYLENLKGDLNK